MERDKEDSKVGFFFKYFVGSLVISKIFKRNVLSLILHSKTILKNTNLFQVFAQMSPILIGAANTLSNSFFFPLITS